VVAWRAGEKRLESRSNLQFSSSPLRFFAPLREALWSPHSALRAPNFLSNHPSQFQTNSNQFKVIQTKSNQKNSRRRLDSDPSSAGKNRFPIFAAQPFAKRVGSPKVVAFHDPASSAP
jgi:hypothetical protein